MSKSTMSLIKVWQDGERFKIHINELDTLLSVSKSQLPQSYAKIEHWIKEPEKSYITPSSQLWKTNEQLELMKRETLEKLLDDLGEMLYSKDKEESYKALDQMETIENILDEREGYKGND